MPILICEETEEFVLQEETNYFETTFRSDAFISVKTPRGPMRQRCLFREGHQRSGMEMADSLLFCVIFQPLPNYEVLWETQYF